MLPYTFDNIKSLQLNLHFCKLSPMLSTFCLLMSALKIQKLKILIYDGEVQKIRANEVFRNAQGTDGKCPNLQVVQMMGVNWLSNEMTFIEIILSKARLLHTLYIIHGKAEYY